MTRTSEEPADLPSNLRAFLAAHTARDPETALAAFTPDAVVVDQDEAFRGTDELRGFLSAGGAQFSYTTELTGVAHLKDGRWVATQRLEGDFPGGVVDLDFRFALRGDLIAELVIATH